MIKTLFISACCFPGFGFPHAGAQENPCQMKQIATFSQTIDSVQYVYNFHQGIDASNEDCLYLMAEGYYNTIPPSGVKLLKVLFVEYTSQVQKEHNKAETGNGKYDRKIFMNETRLIFVYDTKTGFNESYTDKEKIKQWLKK